MPLLLADILILYLVLTTGLPAFERWIATRPGAANVVRLAQAIPFGELGVLAAWHEELQPKRPPIDKNASAIMSIRR